MFLGSNVYVQCFVQTMDLPPQDLANYEIVIRVDGSIDRRHYNAPTSSEVAGLIMVSEWGGCMPTFWCPILCCFLWCCRPNCYVPPQHVPSIIQANVPAVPDLFSLLCLLIGDGDLDGDPEGSNPQDIKVRARGEGL